MAKYCCILITRVLSPDNESMGLASSIVDCTGSRVTNKLDRLDNLNAVSIALLIMEQLTNSEKPRLDDAGKTLKGFVNDMSKEIASKFFSSYQPPSSYMCGREEMTVS